MAQVTKFVCDHCRVEVVDTYLEPGWIRITGQITRSWGRRKNGKTGDGQTDFLTNPEFCGVKCMVAALDKERRTRQGPKPLDMPEAPPELQEEADPFKTRPPWEDPLADDEDTGIGHP